MNVFTFCAMTWIIRYHVPVLRHVKWKYFHTNNSRFTPVQESRKLAGQI